MFCRSEVIQQSVNLTSLLLLSNLLAASFLLFFFHPHLSPFCTCFKQQLLQQSSHFCCWDESSGQLSGTCRWLQCYNSIFLRKAFCLQLSSLVVCFHWISTHDRVKSQLANSYLNSIINHRRVKWTWTACHHVGQWIPKFIKVFNRIISGRL